MLQNLILMLGTLFTKHSQRHQSRQRVLKQQSISKPPYPMWSALSNGWRAITTSHWLPGHTRYGWHIRSQDYQRILWRKSMEKSIGEIEYGIFLALLQYCRKMPKAIPRAGVETAVKNLN